jgi:hypothetical protein
MPRETRTITRDDLISNEDYALIRQTKRAENVARKKRRSMSVGPFVTVLFECWDSMWLQIQDMLYIEKGGEAQIADELAAYNPMVPNGRELTATVLIEIEDAQRRTQILSTLGGIEDAMYLDVAGHKIKAVPESDVERTNDAGKTSAVHFFHFPFTDEDIAHFRDMNQSVTFVIEHPNYGHMARMPQTVREELSKDFD